MNNEEWHVRNLPVPAEASVFQYYPHHDLADAYAVSLPCDANRDIELLARSIFERPAPLVTMLMMVRDAIMRLFGVKTAHALRTSSVPNNRIGIFRIYEKTANEILLGEDDRHLDFRISVLLRTPPDAKNDAPSLVVSTVVHCHNRLGRIYLTVIAPFHRFVARHILQRAARAGWPSAIY
jgi:hypothetical protein